MSERLRLASAMVPRTTAVMKRTLLDARVQSASAQAIIAARRRS
jgi:hypothetical protein